MGARGIDGGTSRTSCSTARSSPTACAGSSISRRVATRAPTSRRFSIAKRDAIARSSIGMRDSYRRSMRAPSGSRSIIRCSAVGASGRARYDEASAQSASHAKSVKIHGFAAAEAPVHVFSRLPSSPDHPVALTIGNFDGVHRGHQAMLSRLVEAAEDLALPSAVLTFDPHPREFFAPRHRAAAAVVSCAASSSVSRALGVERTYVARFDAALARLSPAAIHRRGARAPAGRALGAGRRGLSLRQGPRRRYRDAARRGARRSASRRCAPCRSTASALRRPRCARRSRAATSRAPRRCSDVRSRWRAASRTAQSSAATSGSRPPTSPCAASRRVCRNLRRPRARPRERAAHRRREPRRAADGQRRRASRCSKCSSSISTKRSTGVASRSSSCTSCATRSAIADLDALDAADPRRRGASARFLRASDSPRARRALIATTTTPHARRSEDRLQDRR